MAAILLGFAAAAVGLIVGLTLLNGDDGTTKRADRGQTAQRQRRVERQTPAQAKTNPGPQAQVQR